MPHPTVDEERHRLGKLASEAIAKVVRDRMFASRRGAIAKPVFVTPTAMATNIVLDPTTRPQARTGMDRCGRTSVRRRSFNPRTFNEAWPRLMRAATAAAYVDEVSVEAFRRRVRSGTYTGAVRFPGRGEVWLRDDLDNDIDRLSNRVDKIGDAADVL